MAALQPFEASPFRSVFDDPAFGFQLVADGIGAFEIFGFASGLPLFEQSAYFCRHFHFCRRADA